MTQKVQILIFTVGFLSVILGTAMFVPAFIDYADGHTNALAFFWTAIISLFAGGALFLSQSGATKSLNIKQSFLVVSVGWAYAGFLCALPFFYSNASLGLADSLFEAFSGVTTTGATILAEPENQSRGILIWRSLMQWIGGFATIAFAILLLPYLRVGGMQLFRTELSDRSDKLMPQTENIIKSLFMIYGGLTIAAAVTYKTLGMGGFDAINHAMTTLSTGGFSTRNGSFGDFADPYLFSAAMVFMIAAALPFVLYVKFFYGRRFEFFQDSQLVTFLQLAGVFVSVLVFWLWLNTPRTLDESLLQGSFQVISILTTTGYTLGDYTQWGPFPVMFLFLLLYLGGASASTSGGIKIWRLIVVASTVKKLFRDLLYPSGVSTVKYQGKTVSDAVVQDVMGFLCLFVVANTALSIALGLTGLDFKTALSGAATVLSNVGPGIGDIIGPTGSYAPLPDSAKIMLAFGMVLGRLEIMTLLILLNPRFWK